MCELRENFVMNGKSRHHLISAVKTAPWEMHGGKPSSPNSRLLRRTLGKNYPHFVYNLSQNGDKFQLKF